MERKVVFFDIDGTLTWFDGKSIVMPESSRLAVKKLREKGHIAIVCSGRPLGYILQRFGEGTFDGYISANGTYITYNGECIYKRSLDLSMMRKIINLVDSLEISCGLIGPYKGYSHKMDRNRIERENAQFLKEPYILEEWNIDDIEATGLEVYYKENSDLQKCIEHFEGELIFNSHGSDMSADVSFKDWGKAQAIKYFTEYIGLPIEDTYAVGDGYNDIGMIKAVKTGIAMGNAVQEVKEVADYITSEVSEDGVYKALERFKLI